MIDESTDWLAKFLRYTEGIPSPEVFRLWSGISAIAGALERRVFVSTARAVLYPNLYVLLVGAPGSGKSQAISQVEEMWRAVKKFYVAPQNVTKAALLDALEKADRKIILPNNTVLEYHTLLVAADEFGVLCPAHDLEFLSVLNRIYDCPKVHDEERRHIKKRTEIIKPQMNLLAGSQPGFMQHLLPDEAWTMGFTSRLIMIYSSDYILPDLFGESDPRDSEMKDLVQGLTEMSKQIGQFVWDKDAAEEMQRWHRTRCEPEPDHSKLLHYNQRRILHVLKLCMISAISRSNELRITMDDVNRARDWLLSAEQSMPDIFREMHGKSDDKVIQDLHYYAWARWSKTRKPLHESLLVHFLSTRVPSEKINRILEIAERSNMLVRDAGTKLYTPRPKHEHGVE